MDKTSHGARLLQKLDLLRKTRAPSELEKRRNGFGFLKWKQPAPGFAVARCAVCLHVHRISGLPLPMDGRVVVVAWRNMGCTGEQTLPVHVSGGAATFDEIFLRYCKGDAQLAFLKSFMVRVSLVDAVDCDLGAFQVDLSELASVEDLNPNFGGKAMSFDLEGLGSGGVLSVSVYCRMMEDDTHDSNSNSNGHKESKTTGCFSCLPGLNCLRSRPDATISGLRVLSLRSDSGFITIENAIKNGLMTDEEEEGFIMIEKGTSCTRGARRPPSDDLASTDEEARGLDGDGKPRLLIELKEEFDVDSSVEDEFLRILDEKRWGARDGREGTKLSLGLGDELDMEWLVREAEMEIAKAAQVWRSRVVAALVEREEFEELKRKNIWRLNESSSGCSPGVGFGSPM